MKAFILWELISLELRIYEQNKIIHAVKSPPFREDLGGFTCLRII